jgi:gamma-glutamylputrescine oxidase
MGRRFHRNKAAVPVPCRPGVWEIRKTMPVSSLTWYEVTGIEAPQRPALGRDIDVDIAVIGAGLAGLTAAYELARAGWSVAVLEAGRVGQGASGRNGGFVSPGFALSMDAVVEKVGLPAARRLWDLSVEGVEGVRAMLERPTMRGVTPRFGRLSVWRIDQLGEAASLVDRMRNGFGAQVELWTTAHVRSVLKSQRYFQAIHYPAGFHLHPLNYTRGVAATAERAGARIYETTPVTAIDPAGIRKRITTPQGRVRAEHIVLAGSSRLSPLMPQVSRACLPVATHIVVTEKLGAALGEAVRFAGAIADTRRAGHYFRIVDGDRLLWGGRISTFTTPPWGLSGSMARDIRRVFPQLGRPAIDHVWTGVMGYALHKMPHIGEIAPGVWVASAFGGHGLNTTAMAGMLVARGIIRRDRAWEAFRPFGFDKALGLFPLDGWVGRIGTQLAYWRLQIADHWTEMRHRRATADDKNDGIVELR